MSHSYVLSSPNSGPLRSLNDWDSANVTINTANSRSWYVHSGYHFRQRRTNFFVSCHHLINLPYFRIPVLCQSVQIFSFQGIMVKSRVLFAASAEWGIRWIVIYTVYTINQTRNARELVQHVIFGFNTCLHKSEATPTFEAISPPGQVWWAAPGTRREDIRADWVSFYLPSQKPE
jgi:hypothetical protein